jgi:hypothetical protein
MMTVKEIAKERLDICHACPNAKKVEMLVFCKKCYCNMNAKVWIMQAKCPDDKWKAK